MTHRLTSRLTTFVLIASAVLLASTGLAKLWSALGTARALMAPDPLSGIPFKYLLAGVGVIEIVVATICFLGRSRLFSAGLVAWLSTNFLLYRIGLWWIGWKQPCGCMGSLTDALHIKPETADNIAKVILAYLLISSYGLLIREWRDVRRGRLASLQGQNAEAKAPIGGLVALVLLTAVFPVQGETLLIDTEVSFFRMLRNSQGQKGVSQCYCNVQIPSIDCWSEFKGVLAFEMR